MIWKENLRKLENIRGRRVLVVEKFRGKIKDSRRDKRGRRKSISLRVRHYV